MSEIHLTPRRVLNEALDLVEEYQDAEMTLTLRQLYYQFVTRKLSENGQKHYKRIGAILTKARYEGQFPIDGVDDRGRELHTGDFIKNAIHVEHALNDCAKWFKKAPDIFIRKARWFNQSTFVSVWVEKDALANVVEPVANDLGVSWLACKGYPSLSVLRDFMLQAKLRTSGAAWLDDYGNPCRGTAKKVVVLYLGDHDPDGLQIPISAEESIRTLMPVTGWNFDLTFKRIALNRDQIAQYNPPPFPAKQSSVRFNRYVKATGLRDAWELDALDPKVLRELIKKEVSSYFDLGIRRRELDEYQRARDEFKDCISEPGWAQTAVDGEYEGISLDLLTEDDMKEKLAPKRGGGFDDDDREFDADDDYNDTDDDEEDE